MTPESTPQRPPAPILLVGMNRSGTKWLSNILCNHPDVFGVAMERHTGILETNLFGKMQDLLGGLGRVEHYIAFVELWSQTDFFKATGVEKEFLYRRADRPRTMLDAFRLVLEEAARRSGARFWLQKTSPIEAPAVLPMFPGVRVVTIQRPLVPTLESGSKLRRDRGEADSLLKSAAVYAYEAKWLERIRRDQAAIHVDYETLRRTPEAEIQRVCAAIGIAYRPQMLEIPFTANTSFGSGSASADRLGATQRAVATATEALVRSLPLGLLTRLRDPFRRRRALLVPGTFSEIAERHQLS